MKDFRVDFVDKYGRKDYYILPKGANIAWNGPHMMQSEIYGWKNPFKWDINNYLDDNGKFVKSADVKSTDPKFRATIFQLLLVTECNSK